MFKPEWFIPLIQSKVKYSAVIIAKMIYNLCSIRETERERQRHSKTYKEKEKHKDSDRDKEKERNKVGDKDRCEKESLSVLFYYFLHLFRMIVNSQQTGQICQYQWYTQKL